MEIYYRGVWYSGELLGWRFDDSGRARARVRCVVDGLRHSAWKELADLRLPEPGTAGTAAAAEPQRPELAGPAAMPAAQWTAIGRHEAAAPSWSPDRKRRPSVADDGDTQPHALLIDRDLPRRPPVPRPRAALRSPNTPDRLGSA